MAMAFPLRELVPGRGWPSGAASPACEQRTEGGAELGETQRRVQAGRVSYIPTQLRDRVAPSRYRYSHRSGAAGAFGSADDAGLYACAGLAFAGVTSPLG